MLDTLRDSPKLESAAGTLLVGAAVLATIRANSPLADLYGAPIELPVERRIASWLPTVGGERR